MMTSALIREIAEQVVNEQILTNWKFYAVFAAFSVVSAAFGSYVGSYLKKRGETLATKSDMKEVLAQLTMTTRVAEETRSSVAHADWALKEWRTVRRVKLEELMTAVVRTPVWLVDYQKKWWLEAAPATDDTLPLDTVLVLGSLYFPELSDEIALFEQRMRSMITFTLDSARKLRGLPKATERDVISYGKVLEELTGLWGQARQEHQEALLLLVNRVRLLMREIGTGS